MAVRRRPPLFVETIRVPRLGLKVPQWRCGVDFVGAEFALRRGSEVRAVVHRSTKKSGRWQVSYFENGLATGDTQEGSCAEAVKQLSPRAWRVVTMLPSPRRR